MKQSKFISLKNKIMKDKAVVIARLVVLLFAALFLVASMIFVAATSLDGSTLPDGNFANADKAERVTVSVIYGSHNFATCNSPIMTVKELLDRLEIEIGENTILNCSENDIITDEMTINVDISETEIVNEIVEIPFDTVYIDSQTIPKGEIKLVSAGKNGKSRITHLITKINGETVSDVITDTSVITERVKEVCTRGVGGTVTAEDGTVYSYSYYIDVIATAYRTGGVTATGKEANEEVVAVDPKVIPYGTKIFVTGSYKEIGVRSAEDTGNFKGNHIDVCMEGTLSELLQFGRRKMRAYILE